MNITATFDCKDDAHSESPDRQFGDDAKERERVEELVRSLFDQPVEMIIVGNVEPVRIVSLKLQ